MLSTRDGGRYMDKNCQELRMGNFVAKAFNDGGEK